jgi:hypothetical protein
MTIDTLLDHSRTVHRDETLCDALKLIGDMDIRPIHDEGWLDEPYETDHRQDDDTVDAEEWMEDYLDDAA